MCKKSTIEAEYSWIFSCFSDGLRRGYDLHDFHVIISSCIPAHQNLLYMFFHLITFLQVNGTAVGFMSVRSNVNTSLLNECFDLTPFDGLRKGSSTVSESTSGEISASATKRLSTQLFHMHSFLGVSNGMPDCIVLLDETLLKLVTL